MLADMYTPEADDTRLRSQEIAPKRILDEFSCSLASLTIERAFFVSMDSSRCTYHYYPVGSEVMGILSILNYSHV